MRKALLEKLYNFMHRIYLETGNQSIRIYRLHKRQRLCALFELEEPDLGYDLQIGNPDRPSNDLQKAEEFLEENVGIAVDYH